MVTGTLPPFARQGQQIDVTVSSLGNAKSLRGGTLLLTPLRGADSRVYAVAQGNLVVPGAGASAAGSSVQINTLNAGRIPAGATVEREVPTPVGQGEYVYLEANQADFTTATRIVEAVNGVFGTETATAVDARQIRVRAPLDSTQRVAFLSRLENIVVQPGEAPPKVIINARTGSVVLTQMVRVSECAVSHGSLSITIIARAAGVPARSRSRGADRGHRAGAGADAGADFQGPAHPRHRQPERRGQGAQRGGRHAVRSARDPAGDEGGRGAEGGAGSHLEQDDGLVRCEGAGRTDAERLTLRTDALRTGPDVLAAYQSHASSPDASSIAIPWIPLPSPPASRPIPSRSAT